MNRKRWILLCVVGFVTFSPAAGGLRAEETLGKMQVGVQAGIALPQISSELGTTFNVSLDVGYEVWANLTPFLALGYSQPPVDVGGEDSRLTAGSFSTSTTQRELTLTLGAIWRLFPRGTPINFYGGLGARVYFLETKTNGSAGGSSFLENRETSTRFGGVGDLGAELVLGPGTLTFTVEVGGSPLPHLITGDVQTTAIGTLVGYRLFFL